MQTDCPKSHTVSSASTTFNLEISNPSTTDSRTLIINSTQLFFPSAWQMELYASGFNAWGQLYFDGHSKHGHQEHDLYRFACAFRDGHIEHVQSSLSCTIGKYVSVCEVTTSPTQELTKGFLPQ